jgi:hypothetical protein
MEDLTGQSRAAQPAAAPVAAPAPTADVWYLVYRDETNQPHTVKGSTDGIRKALRERLLGDPTGILVSRTKHGQFVPLRSTPEFRDLVVSPTPAPLPVPGERQPDPNATADYAPSPQPLGGSGVHRGRPTPTGRNPPHPTAAPVGSRTRPTPPPGAPDEGTVPYNATPTPVPVSQPTSTPAERDRRARDRHDDRDAPPRRKPGFDWTPILLLVVALLSAVIGYLLFFQK